MWGWIWMFDPSFYFAWLLVSNCLPLVLLVWLLSIPQSSIKVISDFSCPEGSGSNSLQNRPYITSGRIRYHVPPMSELSFHRSKNGRFLTTKLRNFPTLHL
ncbi:hypothetical protein PoB_001642800 [Plakobranchus ocellatus]|uniref:Secreted protein n=1 Tax=Plakobranchus ocellatus TaxID=259542 RepID=A0AAV3Z5I1_9GAST|nr:hypothetical protein PoB_001642800 [Plakobranchus ocellatus]